MCRPCVRLLVSPTSLLKRTGEIPIMSAQSSQQVCLPANNKLISPDSWSQLTQPPPAYLSVAISSPFSPHCLRLVIEEQLCYGWSRKRPVPNDLFQMGEMGALLSANFLMSVCKFLFFRVLMRGWTRAHYGRENSAGWRLLTVAE